MYMGEEEGDYGRKSCKKEKQMGLKRGLEKESKEKAERIGQRDCER